MHLCRGGQQYNDDATHIDNTMAEYASEAQDILATMMEMTEAIEGISRAVEESAKRRDRCSHEH